MTSTMTLDPTWTGKVPVDDTTLAVTDTGGAGIPVIYCNGKFTTRSCWNQVITDLGPGFRHITFDRRTRDRSKESSGLSFGAAVRDIDAVLSARAVERTLVVGWSYGASLAARWAGRNPERCIGAVPVEDAQPHYWLDESMELHIRKLFMGWFLPLLRPTGLTPRMNAATLTECDIELDKRARARNLDLLLDAIAVPTRYVLAPTGGRGDQQDVIRASLDLVVERNPNIEISATVASTHDRVLKDDYRAVADAVREVAYLGGGGAE